MLISDIFQEIIHITQDLMGLGLTVEENVPIRDGINISWKNEKRLSNVIKNISYIDKYTMLVEYKNFNFKLLDGALVQLQYAFSQNGKHLSRHRLAYYPSPKHERYEATPTDYEEKYFGDSEFHDLIDKNTITFPFRFDFSDDSKKFISIHHPYCHLHLGEYDTCRIPVSSPLCPAQFINFILRNFYYTAINQYCDDYHKTSKIYFEKTISKKEEKSLHLSFFK